MEILITINGKAWSRDVPPHRLLVQFIRQDCGLTGTRIGCETSYCGACTVLVEGKAVKSCSMLAVQADGCEVVTVEGLANGDQLHPIQESFSLHHGLQCGYCTPGMVMTAVALLDEKEDPSREEIAGGLDGNLCRCTGYQTIVNAIEDAGRRLRGEPIMLPVWTADQPTGHEDAP